VKRLLLMLSLAGLLGGTGLAASPIPVPRVGTTSHPAGAPVPPPEPSTDPCADQQAALDQAKAASLAYPPGSLSVAAAKAVKADLQTKRVALKCCRNPNLYGCSK
jgi:hypothetical protein